MIRVLVVGCGDVAMRAAKLLDGRARLVGLTRRADEVAKLREHGVVPLVGDLDDLRTLARLRAAPDAVLHFAPPPPGGRGDPRTGRLVAALSAARRIPRRLVYVSTTGVYGDCAGARVAETRPRRAQSPRARRRVDAEDRLRSWAVRNGVSLAILRAPGIYAQTRLPLERIRQGTPVLVPEHDVYTNHIHADDLARAVVAALFRGRPNRAYHASDDSELRMGQWFDALADAHRLPRPPRVDWEEAEARIAPVLLSFMNESRRLTNERLKRELRVRLVYATPQAMFDASAAREPRRQMPLAF
ncbi:MAG: SDR family oxidoreductase [Burkholderiales bacterium]|nr:SDR family oxidoreductase [Burkholderiales bacterium]MCE7876893.1 SDR family oxidoreductase [Betaproteobacteria bacterium PRO3]